MSDRFVAPYRRASLLQRHAFRPIFVCLLLAALPALAQDGSALSVDLIDQQLNDPARQLSPEDRARLTEAKAFIDARASFQDRAESYQTVLETDPDRLKSLQNRLDGYGADWQVDDALAGFTQAELQARGQAARAEQAELRAREEALNQLSDGLNPGEIAARREEINTRLAELSERAVAPIVEPLGLKQTAERESLTAELAMLVVALDSFELRRELVALERAEVDLLLDRQNQIARAVDSRLAPVTPASTLSHSVVSTDPAYAVAEWLVELDRAVVDRDVATPTNEQALKRRLDEISDYKRLIEQRTRVVERLVELSSDPEASADILLKYWAELNAAGGAPSADAGEQLGSAVAQRLRLQNELGNVLSAPVFLAEAYARFGVEAAAVSAKTRAQLLDLTRSYRESLRAGLGRTSAYIELLYQLASDSAPLPAQTKTYRALIAALVQWVPSQPRLWAATGSAVQQEAQQLLPNLGGYAERVDLAPRWLLMALLAALLLFSQARMKTLQRRGDAELNRPRTDTMRSTALGVMMLVLRALPIPLLVFAAANSFLSGREEALAIAVHASALLFCLLVLRKLCEPDGLAQLHFQWSDATVKETWNDAAYLLRVSIPLTAIAALAYLLADIDSGLYLARFFLVLALLLLIARLTTQVWRRRQVDDGVTADWGSRLRVLLVLTLGLVVVAMAFGQVYSATALLNCISLTFQAAVYTVLLRSLLTRWIKLARRRLRFAELVAQRENEQPVDGTVIEEETLSLVEVSDETQELVTVSTVALFATALFFIWRPMLPALDFLDDWVLWTTTAQTEAGVITNQITGGTVLSSIFLIALTFYIAKRLPAVVEIVLRQRTTISAGARYTISTVMNYVIVGVGVLYGLSALGLQWSQLQWLVAALGVGIGFGLQEIVANFISGLIILFERPIRVGDVVSVGGRDGKVAKIRIRATTIRDWDGRELLVPNKEFITGQLLNWTLSDSQSRIVITVGVAYGSNVEQALALLLDIVKSHPDTLEDPEPMIVFEHFGDNALDLSARCFVGAMSDRVRTMTELRLRINAEFEKAGLVIAYPQRDVHLDGEIRMLPAGV